MQWLSVAVRDAIVKAGTSLGYSKLKLEQEQAIATGNDALWCYQLDMASCYVLSCYPECCVPGLPSK